MDYIYIICLAIITVLISCMFMVIRKKLKEYDQFIDEDKKRYKRRCQSHLRGNNAT